MRRLLPCALPLLAACYTYARVDSGSLHPGMGVRLRLSSSAAERLEPLLGTTDARLLSGVLVDAGRDTLIVEVPTRTNAEIGGSVRTLNQRVGVARSALVEIEARSLDRVRTGLVVGTSAVLAGAVVLRSIKGQPGLDRTPGSGGGTDFRVLVLRIRP